MTPDRKFALERDLASIRLGIDDVDARLLPLLRARAALSERAGEAKSALGRPVVDRDREAAVLARFPPGVQRDMMRGIVRACAEAQQEARRPPPTPIPGPGRAPGRVSLLDAWPSLVVIALISACLTALILLSGLSAPFRP